MKSLSLTIAALLLTSASVQTPVPAGPELASARRHFRQGDFQGAAGAYREMIARQPSPEAWAGLVQSLLKQDEVKSAEASSSQALQAFPKSALVHAARGDVEFRLGLMSAAVDEYQIALTLDPECARAWLGQGKMHAVMARRSRAKEAVAKAHELDADDGDALYEWAIRQPYPASVTGLEKHLAEFRSDAETEGHERDYMELVRALKGRDVWVLQSEPARTEIKIDPIFLGTGHVTRGYGMRVGLNGKATATLLVDTGASGVTITRKLAEKIGAGRLSDQSFEGVGKGGATHGYTAWVDKVTIGDLEFHDCFVHVTPQPVAEVDGIIGTDVFEKFLVTVNFPAHRVRLELLPDPVASSFVGASLGVTAGPPVEPPSFSQAFGFGHLLLLEAHAGDKASGLFVLDTGSNINTVLPELGKGIGQMRPLNATGMGMSGSASMQYVADGVTLEFAKIRRRGQKVFTLDLHAVSKDLGTEVSGQIGFTALEEGSLVINYRDGLVGFIEKK